MQQADTCNSSAILLMERMALFPSPVPSRTLVLARPERSHVPKCFLDVARGSHRRSHTAGGDHAPVTVGRLLQRSDIWLADFRAATCSGTSKFFRQLVWQSKPRNAEDFIDAFQDRTGGGS
jgi:hypothetical protein